MSQTTKKALVASLKKLLAQKPLDKITVIDIVEDCEVNRQTFYYHFQDIYDLIEWMFLSESTKALDGKKTYDTWQQGFLQIFEYVELNKTLITHVYHSISRAHLERFLCNETYNLLIGVINEKAKDMVIRNDDKNFIANFYKFAFVGLMLDWIETGMKEEPSFIIDRLNILIHGDVTKALTKYSRTLSI
ncbi:MAG: TetR/AcrR family transcriptional regulator [Velocimicrobium sp.]